MDEYDISLILDEMEDELLKSMKGHLSEGLQGTTEEWRNKQLQEIQRFKKENRQIIKKYRKRLMNESESYLKDAYKNKFREQINFYEKHSHGKTLRKIKNLNENDFYKINDTRMNLFINQVLYDLDDKMVSCMRQSEDEYRKTIFRTETYMQTGQYDLVSAINLATKDFCNVGILYVTYKNGMKMPAKFYSEMVLRTNYMRTSHEVSGMLRDYLDLHLVRVSHHQFECPKCGKWSTKILVDDVYSNGKPDGKHPLLSQAVKEGLLHPNCRHILRTYAPDVDEDYGEKKYTEQDKKDYQAEQKQRKIEREIRKLKREQNVHLGSTKEIQEKQRELEKHLTENNRLKRKRWRENN